MPSGSPSSTDNQQTPQPSQTTPDDDADHVEEVAADRIQEEIDDNRDAAR